MPTNALAALLKDSVMQDMPELDESLLDEIIDEYLSTSTRLRYAYASAVDTVEFLVVGKTEERDPLNGCG